MVEGRVQLRKDNQGPEHGNEPEATDGPARVIDEAIRSLWAEEPDVGHAARTGMGFFAYPPGKGIFQTRPGRD
jgi:hypothetical protein